MDLISVIYTSVILFAALTFFILIVSYLSFKMKGNQKKVAKKGNITKHQEPRLVSFDNNSSHKNYMLIDNFDEERYISYSQNCYQNEIRKSGYIPKSKSVKKCRATIVNFQTGTYSSKKIKHSISKSALNYYASEKDKNFYSIKTA